jgi:hypothetical protein
VAATYFGDFEPARVRLSFDRAIDASAIDGTQIIVHDPDLFARIFDGTGGWMMIDPATIEITLVSLGGWGDGGITLTASATTGIVGVDDGGEWAGATDLPMPFP